MSRLERIQSLIKEAVAEILRRKVQNSKIGFISITEVQVSKPIDHAWVYFSQIGNEKEKRETLKALKTVEKFVSAEVGKVVQTRNSPRIHFVFDESLERGVDLVNKINALEL